MSKYILIAACVLLFIGAAAGGYYYFQVLPRRQPTVSQTPSPTPTMAEKETVFQTYEDEAGFTFSYPKGMTVSQRDLNDSTVYSSLELTSSDYPDEKIVIKISDTTEKSADKWLKTMFKEEQSSSSPATLASLQGIKVNYSQSLVFIGLDSNIAFFVQAPKSNVFWTSTFEKILETFTLDLAQNNSSNASGAGSSTSTSDIIDEGEEIVE